MKEPETTVRFFKTGILKTTLTKQENQSKNNKRKRKKKQIRKELSLITNEILAEKIQKVD